MSKPRTTEFILKGLLNMGLLPHLEFILEASFYVFRERARKGSVYELTKIAEKSVEHLNVKIDQQGWGSYRSLMLLVPEDQFGMLSHELASICQLSGIISFYIVGRPVYISLMTTT